MKCKRPIHNWNSFFFVPFWGGEKLKRKEASNRREIECALNRNGFCSIVESEGHVRCPSIGRHMATRNPSQRSESFNEREMYRCVHGFESEITTQSPIVINWPSVFFWLLRTRLANSDSTYPIAWALIKMKWTNEEKKKKKRITNFSLIRINFSLEQRFLLVLVLLSIFR